jgi:hypothetical protein
MAVTRANAKFRRFFRQLVTQIYFVVPAILILVAGFFFAYQFVRPAPPDKVVMATGAEDGAYNALGKIYAERFRKEGFELVLKTTAGSVENLGLLADPKAEVPVAILQGGIGRPAEHPGLTSPSPDTGPPTAHRSAISSSWRTATASSFAPSRAASRTRSTTR